MTTFWVFVLGALLAAAVLLVFAPWIALWVLDRDDGQATSLVRWLALPVALGIASTYLNGVLNCFRAIGVLALLQILGAAALALLVYPASRLVNTDDLFEMDCASLRITPVDLGLLGGGRVDVPPEPLRKPGSARGGVSDRAQKLPADGAADECVGVPRPSGPQDVGACPRAGRRPW